MGRSICAPFCRGGIIDKLAPERAKHAVAASAKACERIGIRGLGRQPRKARPQTAITNKVKSVVAKSPKIGVQARPETFGSLMTGTGSGQAPRSLGTIPTVQNFYLNDIGVTSRPPLECVLPFVAHAFIEPKGL